MGTSIYFYQYEIKRYIYSRNILDQFILKTPFKIQKDLKIGAQYMYCAPIYVLMYPRYLIGLRPTARKKSSRPLLPNLSCGFLFLGVSGPTCKKFFSI